MEKWKRKQINSIFKDLKVYVPIASILLLIDTVRGGGARE